MTSSDRYVPDAEACWLLETSGTRSAAEPYLSPEIRRRFRGAIGKSPLDTARGVSNPPVAHGLPTSRGGGSPFKTPEVGPGLRDLPWWERPEPNPMSRPLAVYDSLPIGSPIPAGTGEAGDTMRLVGAWIHPLNAVATAYGSWSSSFTAVWTRLVSTSSRGSSFGRALAPAELVTTVGPVARGFSATSIGSADGSVVDAGFVWTDPGGLGTVWMFAVDGETGAHEPAVRLSVGQRTATGARQIGAANPVICAGRFAGQTTVLVAFPVTTSFHDGRPDEHTIEIGLVARTSGGWRYTMRSEVPAYASPRTFASPWNLAAAFDSNRGAWLLAWWDDGIRTVGVGRTGFAESNARTISFAGETIRNNGILVAFNKQTNRFLLQGEHDLVFATFDGVQPVPDFQGDAPLANGGVWATTVDYEAGFEFALASGVTYFPCGDSSHCLIGVGSCVDRRCHAHDGTLAHPQVRERLRRDALVGASPAANWPLDRITTGSQPGPSAVQFLVRVPREQLVVALATGAWGERGLASFSFSHEASAVDFDDSDLP